MNPKDKSSTQINVGPQHPALKEPETFRIVVEGEKVVHATPILGHTHRGIEKLAESRDYNKLLYLAERICGICSFAHQANYAKGVEIIAGLEVPPRAQYLRVIVAELERLHSHLLWVGVLAHEIGFDTFYLLVWKDRELVMDLLETLTGNRVNYGMNRIGGVRSDLTPEIRQKFKKVLPELRNRLDHIKEIALNDPTMKTRCKGIGIISQRLARETCVTGPTARTSGINWDLRRDAPYFAYEDFSFKVPISDKGDVYSKVVLRIEELYESISIIEQALDTIPDGEIFAKPPSRLNGKAVSRLEAPRGENFHYLDFRDSKTPYRMKVRAPTYANLASSIRALIGHHIADVPVIVAANDPCFSCTDRTLVINLDTGEQKMLTKKELRNIGIKIYNEGLL